MTTLPMIRFLDRTTPPHILTLVLITGMSALSMSIFLPSLAAMTTYFDTEYAIMQIALSGYLAATAVLQVFIGPISDRYGRRVLVLGSLAIFVIASVGAMLATSVEVFLFFRIMQAAVATSMALGRAIVRDMVPEDQAASMIGYVTMGMALVPMISPAVGGLLEQSFGWQATFWAMFWIGALVLAITWFDLGETHVASGRTLTQQFAEYPELLGSPRFWGYSMAAACCSGAFFAYLGGAPFVGSVVFGMEPAELGIYFGAPAVGYFLGNFITARKATVVGVNTLVLWGCLANAIGGSVSMMIFLLGYGSPLSFFGMMTLVGLGNGLCIPNATAGLLSVRPHLAGTASGLGGAIMIGGGAGLSILAGALLSEETGAYPLLWIMLATAVAGVASILVVIRRERALGIA